MKNKSISDFVAASMDSVLNSDSHKSLFSSQYKFASDENDAKKRATCKHCKEDPKDCKCADKNKAWDSEDHMSSDDLMSSKDYHSAKSCTNCKEDLDNCYCNMSDDGMTHDYMSDDGMTHDYMSDDGMAHDSVMHTKKALNTAIKSLLTASAALDSIGLDDGSVVSLKLASLIVEAKKEMSSAEKKKLMERLQKGKKKHNKDKKKSTKTTSKSSKKYKLESKANDESIGMFFGSDLALITVLTTLKSQLQQLKIAEIDKLIPDLNSILTSINEGNLDKVKSQIKSFAKKITDIINSNSAAMVNPVTPIILASLKMLEAI